MRETRWFIAAGLALLITLAGLARWELFAQDRPAERVERTRGPSVQDVLLRRYPLRFERETTLAQVVQRLRETLGVPVVLDPAALARQQIDPETTVSLDLPDDVRLKTGLRLLLEQVGLTYRVEPDDNLLVLTDLDGADDPAERTLAELQSLHRDVHDLQDAVDDIYRLLTPQVVEPGTQMPTIIEELPEGAEPAPTEPPPTRTRPG